MKMLGLGVDGSKKIHDRRFVANFGCLPRTCADLWKRILGSGQIEFMIKVGSKKRFYVNHPPYKPKHLLWGLYHLKCYPTENQSIGMVGNNEKSYRKWVWVFIEAIASLKNEVVSTIYFIIFLSFINTTLLNPPLFISRFFSIIDINMIKEMTVY